MWLSSFLHSIYLRSCPFLTVYSCLFWCRVSPWWCNSKESTCQCRRCKGFGFNPWVGKILWRRQPTPVFLSGIFHGQRSLVGYSQWGCRQLDMTERLSTINHISMTLFLGSLFCSVDLCICFCASTIWFWWLWLCNIVWNQGA